MNTSFKAVPITDDIYWVGAIDWNISDFHGYATSRGTTYNAFLIMGDPIVLVDTVKAPFKREMLSRIASVTDPSNISIIISNHSEMDHSGSLPDIIDTVKPDKVYASKMGLRAIKGHFHDDFMITPVEDGQSVPIGNREITFYETRMLHWPDSMISYLSGEGILFSQDAFGMHLASTQRFADEVDDFILEYESAKYYANILMPYSPLIGKLHARLGELGLDISMIAPDHGPIWRRPEDMERIISHYASWANKKPANKAVIAYDTMWNSTDVMGRAIADGCAAGGSDVKLMSLHSYHRSDIATELLTAGAFIVGSPTLNNNMFPTVADMLVYLKGLKPRGLVGAAFGSYGWSGESIKHIEQYLTDMKIECVAESVRVEYVPDDDDLARCYELGRSIAERLAVSTQ